VGSSSVRISPRAARPIRDAWAWDPAVAVLGWLLRAQWRLLLGATAVNFAFLGCQQLIPYVVGRAVDDGLVADDRAALYSWSGALAALIGIATLTGVLSFLFMLFSYLETNFRVQRRLVDTVVEIGAPLKRRVEAGELVAISTADSHAFSGLSMLAGRLVSSVLAFALALFILGSQSWWFVLAVGLGLPAMFVVLRPIFLRLESRGSAVRQRIAEQTGISTDAVAGLRVLQGVGGEDHFIARYRSASRATRDAGIRVGRTTAVLEFARIALPGVLLAAVLWLGARMALNGVITAGQFVALFGYLIVLTRPLGYAIQGVDALTRAVVAAKRLKGLEDRRPTERRDAEVPPAGAVLEDPSTGVTAEPGRITAVVLAEESDKDDLLDRLGGYGEHDRPALLGGRPITEWDTVAVRDRVHLLEARAQLFSGPLREQLDVDGRRTDADIMRALHTASAVDIVGVDPSLLDSDDVPTERYDLDITVGERGRNFSGGERQRLILARALLADPDILVLDDPASACDAQTEGRIAERLARHRRGRTTVVVTNAPQLLAACDRVLFVSSDLAEGTHAELLDDADYRKAVSR
jgi:ABC-type multidrug transport system fused ATPase/permease subunit